MADAPSEIVGHRSGQRSAARAGIVALRIADGSVAVLVATKYAMVVLVRLAVCTLAALSCRKQYAVVGVRGYLPV